jgi:predicted nucleic acid-binding protein
MPIPDLFLDSSALFAGIVSPTGAARALLLLGETQLVQLSISEQVVAETERAIARKIPAALSLARQAILNSKTKIYPDPIFSEVEDYMSWMKDPTDVPILVAAMKARVNYLVTLNRRHFLEDVTLAQKAGLLIGTHGDALIYLREQLGNRPRRN